MAERMADREVEETLREIRERVRAASPRAREESPPAPATPPTPDSAAVINLPRASGAHGARASEALARMEANLATTERARERLPPLMSYRAGLAARLELWLKRQIKRALHWFTWEQVNFNSAAHHALADALAALAAHEQLIARAQSDLASLRASLAEAQAEAASERERSAARDAELGSRLAAAEARLAGAEARLEAAEARLVSELTGLRGQLAATAEGLRAEQRAAADGLRAESRDERQAQVNALQNEICERVEHLLEEQRVCFRQLSLETTEAAVMHDRARRLLEARLEKIEKDVNRES